MDKKKIRKKEGEKGRRRESREAKNKRRGAGRRRDEQKIKKKQQSRQIKEKRKESLKQEEDFKPLAGPGLDGLWGENKAGASSRGLTLSLLAPMRASLSRQSLVWRSKSGKRLLSNYFIALRL